MSQYIIEIKDGKPVNHPMILENFVQCFPEIDLGNLPENYAHFEKTDRPILTVYQELLSVHPSYEVANGIVKEVWVIREYSPDEKQRKMDAEKAQPHPNGWLFDEELCCYMPPIEYPTDGKRYVWDDETVNWIEFQNIDAP